MSKQDRQGARTVSEFEQRYNFNKKFSEIMGIATDARNLALKAQKSYDGLSHEQIFNLLTKDGALEGLYEANGQVYINASYIKSGELSADLIKTGVIKSANYKELTDGTPTLGMAIDLDNGIINSPKFKLNDLGEITATGGFIGGFDISETELSAATFNEDENGLIVAETTSIKPGEIKTEAIMNVSGETVITRTKLTAGGIVKEFEDTSGGQNFSLMDVFVNGEWYNIILNIDAAYPEIQVYKVI